MLKPQVARISAATCGSRRRPAYRSAHSGYVRLPKFTKAKIYKQKNRIAPRIIKTTLRVSRRDAPESLKENFPPRGRAGCRAPDAPAASCAKKGSTSAHEYSQRRHRKSRHSRTQWFTMYAVLSSGRCSIAPVIRGLRFCPTRLGRLASAGLDPSIRGGTTRFYRPLQRRSSCATFRRLTGTSWMGLPCQLRSHATLPRPSHPIPRP